MTITWKECWGIEISSITFSLIDKFNISIVLQHTRLVQLSRISVFGNGYNGCRSIMSENSTLYIRDSNFVGIQGTIGAALLISISCVTFTGNNTFIGNSAGYGGSLCLYKSTAVFNGTNTF